MSLKSAVVRNSAETQKFMQWSAEQLERRAVETNKENTESVVRPKREEIKHFSINESAVEEQCIHANNYTIGSEVIKGNNYKEIAELYLNGMEDNDELNTFNNNKQKKEEEQEEEEEEELTLLSERAKMWEALLPYDKSKMLSESSSSSDIEESLRKTMQDHIESSNVIFETTNKEKDRRDRSVNSPEEPTSTKETGIKNMASTSMTKLKDLTNIYVDRDQLYSLEKSPSPSPSPFPISFTGNSVFNLTTRSRNIFASLHRSQSWNKENQARKIDCHVKNTSREEIKEQKKNCSSNDIKYESTAFNKPEEHFTPPPTEPFDLPFTSFKEVPTNNDWKWHEGLSVNSVNPLCHKLNETRQMPEIDSPVIAKSLNESCYKTYGDAHIFNDSNKNKTKSNNNVTDNVDKGNDNKEDDDDDTVKRKKLEEIITYTTNDYSKRYTVNSNNSTKKLSIPSTSMCNEMSVSDANRWHHNNNNNNNNNNQKGPNSTENAIDIDNNIKNSLNSLNKCPLQNINKQNEKVKIKMITVSVEEMNRLKSELNKYRTLYLCERNLIEEKNSNYNELYCNYQQKILENISLKSRGEENKRFIRQLKREIGMSRTHVMEVSNKSLIDKRNYQKQMNLYEERIAELAQIHEEEREEYALKVQALEQLVKDLSCLRLHEQVTLEHAELNSNEQLEEAFAQNESLQALLKASYVKNTMLFDDIVRQAEQLQLLEAKCKKMYAVNNTINDVSNNGNNGYNNDENTTNKRIKNKNANCDECVDNFCKDEEQLENEQEQRLDNCNDRETEANKYANISTTSEQLIKEMQSINAIICKVNTCVNCKKNVDADNNERSLRGNALEGNEALGMEEIELYAEETLSEGQETEPQQEQ